MTLKIDICDGYVIATVTGTAAVREGMDFYKQVLDTAAERGLDKIVLDCLEMVGEVSTVDRYQFAMTIMEHARSVGIRPKVALVGKPPTIDGFGMLVMQNRGEDAAVFASLEEALEWVSR